MTNEELRAQFAMRAPSRPQPWFAPVMPPMPVAPPRVPTLPSVPEFVGTGPDDMDAAGRRNLVLNVAANWLGDPCYSLADFFERQWPDDVIRLFELARPAMAAFEEAWNLYREAHLEMAARARQAGARAVAVGVGGCRPRGAWFCVKRWDHEIRKRDEQLQQEAV